MKSEETIYENGYARNNKTDCRGLLKASPPNYNEMPDQQNYNRSHQKMMNTAAA